MSNIATDGCYIILYYTIWQKCEEAILINLGPVEIPF